MKFKYPHPLFRLQMFMIQWMKIFYVILYIPYYKWIVATASCMYCDLGRFGYAGGAINGTIAPYGFIWYGFYFAISRLGYSMFLIFLLIFDTAIFTVVYRFQSKFYTICFTLSSMLFFTMNPADLLILWLAVLGKEAPVMSILSFLAKLPFFAPLWVWNFVWNVSFHLAGTYYLGWPRYLLLGLWMIHPFFYWLRNLRGCKN